jgi:hypothetical protein
LEVKSPGKLALRPNQERLLQLLRDHGRMTPAQIWVAMPISRQGAMDLLRPLLDAGLVKKTAVRKPVTTPCASHERARGVTCSLLKRQIAIHLWLHVPTAKTFDFLECSGEGWRPFLSP